LFFRNDLLADQYPPTHAPVEMASHRICRGRNKIYVLQILLLVKL